MVILLLGFSRPLATKFVSLDNKPGVIRHTLINLNPVELNYYPFIISLGKCNGICNVANDVSMKICVPSEKKGVCIRVFNMIARVNEVKAFIMKTYFM